MGYMHRCARYMVLRELAGYGIYNDVLYMYYVMGLPVSSIIELTGLNKARVKSWLRTFRIYTCGNSFAIARLCIAKLYRLIKSLDPLYQDGGDGWRTCLVCGDRIHDYLSALTTHLSDDHRDIVEVITMDILSMARCRT